mgnify:CR=1 FL=1
MLDLPPPAVDLPDGTKTGDVNTISGCCKPRGIIGLAFSETGVA